MSKRLEFTAQTPILWWIMRYGSTLETLAAYREKQKEWKQQEIEYRRAERQRLSAERQKLATERKAAKARETAEIRVMRKQLRAVIKGALAEEREHL